MIMVLVLTACSSTTKDKAEYEIASPVYIALAQKSLDYLVSFQYDSFAEMLADSVEYELPNGKKLKGKTAIISFWKDYKAVSGLQSMVIVNANYLPINANTTPKGSGKIGIKVVSDFTNKMTFKEKTIALKMTFSFHFNNQSLIDYLITFYDSARLDFVQPAINNQSLQTKNGVAENRLE